MAKQILFKLIIIVTLALQTRSSATTLTQSASGTVTASEFGKLYVPADGRNYGWNEVPAGRAPDGYTYRTDKLTIDTSSIQPGATIQSAKLSGSWSIAAPHCGNSPLSCVNPNEDIRTQSPNSTLPVKWQDVYTNGWLDRVVFSDGFVYTLSNGPVYGFNALNGSFSVDLSSLGLLDHFLDSTSVQVWTTLDFALGRIYLGDDYQNGHRSPFSSGGPHNALVDTYGQATETAFATLTVSYTAPPQTSTGPLAIAAVPEPTSLSFVIAGSALVAVARLRRRRKK